MRLPEARRADHCACPARPRERGRGGERALPEVARGGALARKGLPIYTNLCQRTADGQAFQCPYFACCEYIQTRQTAYSSPFVILVHAHLGLEWGANAGDRFYEEEDEGVAAERQRHFNPKQANIIVCDEDPTVSLVEEVKLSPEDVRGIGEAGLGDKMLAGLLHPGGLLSYLPDQGISADQLRQAAEEARTTERHRRQVSNPNGGDSDLAHAAKSATRLVRLSRVLERLADELASGRAGVAYSLLVDGSGLIAQGRRPRVFDDQRLLLLDGTANRDILRQFVPQLRDLPEIRVSRNAHVVQVRDLTFFRHSLVERAPAGEDGRGGGQRRGSGRSPISSRGWLRRGGP